MLLQVSGEVFWGRGGQGKDGGGEGLGRGGQAGERTKSKKGCRWWQTLLYSPMPPPELHRPPWFCACEIAGADPRRPIAISCVLPWVREQMFSFLEETPEAAPSPIGYKGGHFVTIVLAAMLSLLFFWVRQIGL